ncbi:synaptotagmin-5-like [Copidosoma floridanum]|uniref:synaptotagmin-5-like n=1 Tax=Copidosoma floridanum TaxID=29053 RepID=UPI0006C99CDF|nr:synaptotagmin-5-like [Copidosoma floridanum]
MMDLEPRRPEILAVMLAVGATTGAVMAVIVYALCARRRNVSLNWFEKDLLERAESAERAQEAALVNLHPTGLLLSAKQQLSPLGSAIVGGRTIEEPGFQPREGIFNNRVREAREVGRHLSECSCDEATQNSPLAPPLPGGALVASDERMVILRRLPLGSSSNGSDAGSSSHTRLSSTDSDDISCPRSANETRGELKLGLTYDAPNGLLNVKLIEARDLRARDLSETADPYAKIRLLPDRATVKQTAIHKQTLHPEFDEDFIFEVPPNCQLSERTLEVHLYDSDSSIKHRGMGYVQMSLSSIPDLCSDQQKIITTSIYRYGGEGRFKAPPLGELMVSLSYQSSAGRLAIIVIRARNLPTNDEINTTFEPYVQVNIMRDGKSLKRKKTGIRREGTSPVWNDTLNFDLTADVLALCSLDFSVYRGNGQLLARAEVSEVRQCELFHRLLTGAGASAQWLPLSEPDVKGYDEPPKSA